jgi:gliding motility-associated-like protein/uncharacterized delta-60 repeat protein
MVIILAAMIIPASRVIVQKGNLQLQHSSTIESQVGYFAGELTLAGSSISYRIDELFHNLLIDFIEMNTRTQKYLLFYFLLFHTTFPGHSQRVSFDSTFGVNARTFTQIGTPGGFSSVYKFTTVRPDGSFYMAGDYNQTDTNFFVTKFKNTGIIDSSYAVDGKLYINKANFGVTSILASGIDSSLRFFFVGKTPSPSGPSYFLLKVIRYTAAAVVDSSFGVNGIATIPFDNIVNSGINYLVGAYPDGRLLISSYQGQNTVISNALIRLKENGSLDSSFAVNGKLFLEQSSGLTNLYSLHIQTDGKIVFARQFNGSLYLFRYNGDGTIDNGFNQSGMINVDYPATNNGFQGDRVLSNNKIILSAGTGAGYYLYRFNANGHRDSTFGPTGFVPYNFGFKTYARDFAEQPDGKVLAAGVIQDNQSIPNINTLITRTNIDGSIDSTYDDDGVWFFNYAGNPSSGMKHLNLLGNGKVLFSGLESGADWTQFTTYRLKFALCSTPPTIISFTPTSGPIGSTVTITGTDFDPIPGNNIVFFGATRATVSAATTTSLTVTVPVGATYQFITVTNACNLTASSANPFNVTFPCGGDITVTSFNTRIDWTMGISPADAEIGDFDGDGKSDIVGSSYGSSFISVYRNTSSSGNILFGPRQDFPSNISGIGLAIGDLDGDGKLDIAEASSSVGSVSLFRNTSSVGNISFAPLVDLLASSMTRLVSIADFDGDGRRDIVATNEGANTISVFKNNSSPGSFSFSPKTDYLIGLDHTWGICTGDIDGDGKPDIAVTNYTNSLVSVFRNTSTAGSISFAPKVDFSPGTNPTGISMGDLDGDGKADLAVANQTSNNISVFLNNSTPGNISFAPKVDFNTASSPTPISITDLNGDGKPDLSVGALSAGLISVLKNTSTAGNISFAPNVDFPTGGGPPLSVALGDFDGDTKPDCLFPSWTSYHKISIIQNITGGIVIPSVVISTPINTICAGASITFTAAPTNGGINPSYQWRINGINVGANSPTYSSSSLVNGDVITVVMTSTAPCASPTTVTSNSITVSVSPLLIPSASITATATIICAGTSVTFTVTPTNGGPAPAYQWQVNGINVGTNAATYTTTALINGDVVRAIMTSNAACASPITATSNAITMTVNATVAPSVGIAPPSTTICTGTSVTFTATPNNGGSAPAYQWQVNGVNVGTNSAIYSTSSLANGDIVRVVMTSNLTCALPATATSNSITMVVNPSLIPGVSITASSTTICVGAAVTFTATPTNGGATPVYQWKVNGANVGINSSSYTTTSLTNGDVVTVMMTSNATCALPATAMSGAISMSVSSPATASVIIAVSKTTICAGASVTFTATPANGGGAPFYQWQVNGSNVGINSPSYATSTIANGDIVRVIMTSNACVTANVVTSNMITMTVKTPDIPSVNIAASPGNICFGTTVTFTASPTNGGGAPSFQWKLNGTNAGINSPTFISNTLVNGDIIHCLLTSNEVCAGPNTASSNSIQVVIDPALCPMNFYMPTAFTPNKDGKNDLCKPILFGNVLSYKFSIYNRWGQKIFETTNLQKGWDGKVSGFDTDSNIFVWLCNFQFQGQPIQNKKGTVALIR